jgi:hypothetical protein
MSGFGGLGVSTLASGTQVRGFKPDQSRRIFQGEKFLNFASFGGEINMSVHCRGLAALGVEVAICRQNYRKFLAHSSPFPC